MTKEVTKELKDGAELKPCPYCGGEVEIGKKIRSGWIGGLYYDAWEIYCVSCGAEGESLL